MLLVAGHGRDRLRGEGDAGGSPEGHHGKHDGRGDLQG